MKCEVIGNEQDEEFKLVLTLNRHTDNYLIALQHTETNNVEWHVSKNTNKLLILLFTLYRNTESTMKNLFGTFIYSTIGDLLNFDQNFDIIKIRKENVDETNNRNSEKS
jgi:hypothetical protein